MKGSAAVAIVSAFALLPVVGGGSASATVVDSPVPAMLKPSTSAPVQILLTASAPAAAVGDVVRVDVWAQGAAGVSAFEVAASISPSAGRIEWVAADTSAVAPGDRTDISLGDLTGYGVLAAYSPSGRPIGDDGRTHLGVLDVRVAVEGRIDVRVGAAATSDGSGNLLPTKADRVATIQVGASQVRRPAPPMPWALSVQRANARWTAAPVEVQLDWQASRLAQDPCRGNRASRLGGCIDIGDVQRLASTQDQLQSPTAAAGSGQGIRRVDGARSSVIPSLVGTTFTVNARGDGNDANQGDGLCRTTSGLCTLRAAIQEANASAGSDTIRFGISGSAPFVIQLGSRLPALNDWTGPTTIDGFSQPGARVNTDPVVSNAVVLIEIVGKGSDSFDAMAITSPGNTLRGLSIHDARRPLWIYRTGKGSVGNVIQGCVIGTDPSGTVVSPGLVDLGHGIHIEQDSPNTLIGGTSPADRNVISGNARHGIGIWHSWSDGTIVQGNIIGLSPLADRRVPNRKHGVDVNFGASGTLIGGTEVGAGNLISGNDDTGVEISHTTATVDNEVIGNRIGTLASGEAITSWSGNLNHAVWIEDGASRNLVRDNVMGGNGKGGVRIINGGTNGVSSFNVIRDNWISVSPGGNAISNGQAGVIVEGSDNQIGPGNRIVFQSGPGIVSAETRAQRNTFTRNVVHSSLTNRLAIDLAPRGKANLNDPGDADDGPNTLLNFPVISAASTTSVSGTACANCTVEVFATGVVGSGGDGYGPAQAYLGSSVASSDGSFTVTVSGAARGAWLSSTATDTTGASSEMSANFRVS